MSEKNINRDIAVKVSGVKKMYKLGQIGGGTLQADLQSWWARVRGKEDPNTKIGEDQRSYGDTFMALNGVDLTIYQGEAVGIIGSNGAGKSTLLKLLSRVTAPTKGEIDIYGRIASMLEVGTGFNGELTGRENVYMNGAILGMTKAEIDAKMEDIIEFSEVREFIDTPVKRYSSGMFVKLAFSVAAHLDAEIMIMDEVLAVGDMAFQTKCLDKMREAANEEGRTVLYVSHNMNTIRKLCDRCIVLDKGKVVYEGAVDEAIRVYMKSSEKITNTNIDLSDKRMSHLSKEIIAKMTRIELLGKEIPSYEFGETIDFDLYIKTNQKVKDLCVRLEVRSYDGLSVGAGVLQNFTDLEVSNETKLKFSFTPTGLVPGDYNALIVIYRKNEFGQYFDLDAVFPTFDFAIQDNKDAVKINWDNKNWGKIKFNTLQYDKN